MAAGSSRAAGGQGLAGRVYASSGLRFSLVRAHVVCAEAARHCLGTVLGAGWHRWRPLLCQGPVGNTSSAGASLQTPPGLLLAQVLVQRGAVLRVLRELGLGQRELEEKVVECWNKVDLLPYGDPELLPPVEAGAGRPLMEGGREQAAEGGRGAGDSAGRAGSGSGGGGKCAAAAAGLLPAAVEALLGSDPAAVRYRPAAVATSAYSGQGLGELLAAVERKVSFAVRGCSWDPDGAPQAGCSGAAPAQYIARQTTRRGRLRA